MMRTITSSKVRSEIFRLLFGVHSEELHTREIERRSGFAIGSIQTELKKFRGLDLIRTRGDGNRLYCIANRENPLYWDIHNLVMKTTSLEDILTHALLNRDDIHSAFVFGPAARDGKRARGGVDLMIIGNLGPSVAARLLSKASRRIGAPIRPHVLGRNEFRKRKKNRDRFIIRMMAAPKRFIVGNEENLEALVRG